MEIMEEIKKHREEKEKLMEEKRRSMVERLSEARENMLLKKTIELSKFAVIKEDRLLLMHPEELLDQVILIRKTIEKFFKDNFLVIKDSPIFWKLYFENVEMEFSIWSNCFNTVLRKQLKTNENDKELYFKFNNVGIAWTALRSYVYMGFRSRNNYYFKFGKKKAEQVEERVLELIRKGI